MSPVRIDHLVRSTRCWLGRATLGAFVAVVWIAPASAQEPPPLPGAAPAGTGWRPRIVREGTVSLGGQAQYGTFFANTGFGRDYDAGPGMTIRLRYRTSRETALGLSFEGQRMNATEDPVASDDPDWIRGIVTTFDYYQYFRVKKRAPRYLVAGAGLVQTRRQLQNGETEFPGDAGVVTLGAGTEIWWKRGITFDLSARYYLFASGGDGAVELSHNVQAALGFQLYTSK